MLNAYGLAVPTVEDFKANNLLFGLHNTRSLFNILFQVPLDGNSFQKPSHADGLATLYTPDTSKDIENADVRNKKRNALLTFYRSLGHDSFRVLFEHCLASHKTFGCQQVGFEYMSPASFYFLDNSSINTRDCLITLRQEVLTSNELFASFIDLETKAKKGGTRNLLHYSFESEGRTMMSRVETLRDFMDEIGHNNLIKLLQCGFIPSETLWSSRPQHVELRRQITACAANGSLQEVLESTQNIMAWEGQFYNRSQEAELAKSLNKFLPFGAFTFVELSREGDNHTGFMCSKQFLSLAGDHKKTYYNALLEENGVNFTERNNLVTVTRSNLEKITNMGATISDQSLFYTTPIFNRLFRRNDDDKVYHYNNDGDKSILPKALLNLGIKYTLMDVPSCVIVQGADEIAKLAFCGAFIEGEKELRAAHGDSFTKYAGNSPLQVMSSKTRQ